MYHENYLYESVGWESLHMFVLGWFLSPEGGVFFFFLFFFFWPEGTGMCVYAPCCAYFKGHARSPANNKCWKNIWSLPWTERAWSL